MYCLLRRSLPRERRTGMLRRFDQPCACTLTRSLHLQLATFIGEHGGKVSIHESSPTKENIIQSSHIVSPTINFPLYDFANKALIPVVQPSWVHASLAKRKIANPRQYSPDPRLFFKDVVVTCGDIPEGDKNAIIGGVIAKGGLYSPRITGVVTHLVDLTTESDKARMCHLRKLSTKIVLPHWSVIGPWFRCWTSVDFM